MLSLTGLHPIGMRTALTVHFMSRSAVAALPFIVSRTEATDSKRMELTLYHRNCNARMRNSMVAYLKIEKLR